MTTRRDWIVLLICVAAVAVALALGLAGDSLLQQVNLDTTRLLLAAIIVVLVLLAISVRLLSPRRSAGEDVLVTFPVHWGTFFPLGVLVGLLAGFGAVSLLGEGRVGQTIHTYELVGQVAGWAITLVMAFRRAPIMAGAFAIGYGAALPSTILFLDPANDLIVTYVGHISLMLVAAGLVVIFGGFVRIKIVD